MRLRLPAHRAPPQVGGHFASGRRAPDGRRYFKRARAARVAADLSTIYRNLGTFCEMGWLDALPGANGERYYQVHHAEEQTLSVMCLDCGKMTALAAPPPTLALNDAVRGLGLNADTLRVTLAAHCEHDCPRKTGN